MASAVEPDFWVKGLERSVRQGWFSSLTAMAYSQALDLLAVAGGSGHALLLNLRTLDAIEPRIFESGIRCLCFGTEGAIYAGLDNGSVATFSAQGAQLLGAKISRRPIISLFCTDQYGLIVGSEDRRLRRLQPTTLTELASTAKLNWAANDLVLLEQDDQLVVSGSDNNLHLVDPESLAPLLVLHSGSACQTHNAAGHGQIATAGQDGTVTLLDAQAHTQTCVLPIASETLAGLQIPSGQPLLFFADASGVVQEWDLHAIEPQSALQVEGKTKAMAVSASGNVVAVCTDRSVQVFLRASQLSELAWYQQESAWRQSFVGQVVQFIKKLFGRPLPMLPPAPKLPSALAMAALKTDPEVREIERSTSQALVQAYRQVAAAARRVDWKVLGRAVENQQRHQLEAQRMELRRLREERLSKALEEAQKRRELRQQQHRSRELAIRQARAEQRSKQFWEGVGRLVGNVASSAVSSTAAGTWVSSYTRKNGTRVRGYRRR